MENQLSLQQANIIYRQIIFLIGTAIILTACGSPRCCPLPGSDFGSSCRPHSHPVPTPMSFNDLWKSSPHADDDAEAFRHWDEADPQEIPVMCAQCHSRTGFLDFLGVDGTAVDVVDSPPRSAPPSLVTYATTKRRTPWTVSPLLRASGLAVSARRRAASPATRDAARHRPSIRRLKKLELTDEDTPSADLLFINSHSTSAATSFGSEVHGAYEYAGNTYQGRLQPRGRILCLHPLPRPAQPGIKD